MISLLCVYIYCIINLYQIASKNITMQSHTQLSAGYLTILYGMHAVMYIRPVADIDGT